MSRVLICEDNRANLRLVRDLLVRDGHEVLTATTADEGIPLALEQSLDLVILDIIMPKVNGFQICRTIRSDPHTADLPIIIVTAMDRDADRYWGLKQGANEYFIKPVSAETLTEAVCRYLEGI